jgi:hypothetical protein
MLHLSNYGAQMNTLLHWARLSSRWAHRCVTDPQVVSSFVISQRSNILFYEWCLSSRRNKTMPSVTYSRMLVEAFKVSCNDKWVAGYQSNNGLRKSTQYPTYYEIVSPYHPLILV